MSDAPGNAFERRFPNRFQELDRVTEEALKFVVTLGLNPQIVYRVNLAIEELGTNILKYGYDDQGSHEILLRLEVQPAAVQLVLEDDGRAFNPLTAPAPNVELPVEERAVGGLGIHLLRQLVDQMTYERCGERNRLTIMIRR